MQNIFLIILLLLHFSELKSEDCIGSCTKNPEKGVITKLTNSLPQEEFQVSDPLAKKLFNQLPRKSESFKNTFLGVQPSVCHQELTRSDSQLGITCLSEVKKSGQCRNGSITSQKTSCFGTPKNLYPHLENEVLESSVLETKHIITYKKVGGGVTCTKKVQRKLIFKEYKEVSPEYSCHKN